MPSKRTSDGEFRDIAHPINSEMRQEIQEAVMKVYDETEAVEPGTNTVDVAEDATSEAPSQLEESDSQTTLSEDLKA